MSLYRSYALSLFAVSIFTGPAVAFATAVDRVTLDDYGAITEAHSVAISPDGGLVVFVTDGRIRVVPYGGGEARYVTPDGTSASEPRWSADGSFLYFLSDRSGKDQLYRLPVGTFGEAVRLTELERGVSSLALSADESCLLLVMPDDPAPEAAQERSEPWVIDRLEFKVDGGDGYLTERPSDHLYTYDLETAALTQITAGRYAESEPAWSPDGEAVVFVSNREQEPDASYKTDLWFVNANTAGEDNEPVRLTDDGGVKSAPAYSPDGRSIAFLYQVDGVYGISELVLVPAGGGDLRFLTRDLDRWVHGFAFSADGRWIYFNYDDDGGVHLARVPTDGGGIETLADGPIYVSSFAVSNDGRIAAAIATGNRATEIHRVDGAGHGQLTTLNAAFFGRVNPGSKEHVVFESRDGTRIGGFVTRPPNYESGRRYPAILKIHGGPVGQFSWGYDFTTQFYAANGYVVVEPNPRGSTGRGQAFVNAIYRTWGITDYDDVIASVDRAVAAGYADPERLAVTGYSYGGYMTNVVITRTDRFAAAASGAGHSFIAANYGHDIYQKWYNWELGPPWQHPERYERLSPLLDAGKVETPTLFLGGREDWNVPILNAELFYQSLRQRGIDTRLVVYPGVHHGGWPEEFDKDYLARVLAWFDEYARSDTPRTAAH